MRNKRLHKQYILTTYIFLGSYISIRKFLRKFLYSLKTNVFKVDLVQPSAFVRFQRSCRLYYKVEFFILFVEHLNQKFWMQISQIFYGVFHIFDGEWFSYPVVQEMNLFANSVNPTFTIKRFSNVCIFVRTSACLY